MQNASLTHVEQTAQDLCALSLRLQARLTRLDEERRLVERQLRDAHALQDATGLVSTALAPPAHAAPAAAPPGAPDLGAAVPRAARGKTTVLELALAEAKRRERTEATTSDILGWLADAGHGEDAGGPSRNTVYVSLLRERRRPEDQRRVHALGRGRFRFA